MFEKFFFLFFLKHKFFFKKAQSISTDQIHDMKKNNMDKQEIISKLIEGSKSFSEKTNFSQEKV